MDAAEYRRRISLLAETENAFRAGNAVSGRQKDAGSHQ
jgi:hypothetical protein